MQRPGIIHSCGNPPTHTITAPVRQDMPTTEPHPGWTNPEYVATAVGVLAIGTLVFYNSLAQSGPTVDDILFVGLGITVPVTIAHEVARRWS